MPGKAEPKGRHRARVVQPKGGKAWVQYYPEAKTVAWEEHVATTARELIPQIPVRGQDFTLPFTGRVMAYLRFNMHKPVSYPASVVHHTKRPDTDNLAKAVLDALQNARIITEDNQITDLVSIKRYQSDEHPEGVEIDLTAWV